MMTRLLFRITFLIFGVVLVAGCGESPSRPASLSEIDPPGASMPEFREDGRLTFLSDDRETIEIAVEIADTDEARTRGLMQRESLPERSGMLFIFDDEAPRSFWMANTPLSLDIIFVANDSSIVTVRKYTRPMSPESVTSTSPARFVVEVPAGFSDMHGIVEGDRIRWTRALSDER